MAVVASRNIFLDSELTPYGNGESFRIQLPASQFSCKGNQMMRITLTNFEIRKQWYEINQTNNVFFIYSQSLKTLYPVIIPPGSYRQFAPNGVTSTVSTLTTPVTSDKTAYDYSANDLATAIKYAVDKTLYVIKNGGKTSDCNGNYVNNVTYPSSGLFTGSTASTIQWNQVTRKYTILFPTVPAIVSTNADLQILFFQLRNPVNVTSIDTFTNAQQTAILSQSQNINKTLYGDWLFQDSHEIIGGIPIRDSTYKTGMLRYNSNSIYGFVSPYASQLNTLEALYLRLFSSSTNNYQSPSLERDLDNNLGVCPTNIFARIPLPDAVYSDQVELITFTDTGGDIFQTLLDVHQFDNIQMSLTDDKNRLISEIYPDQAKNGCLAFKVTIKWEIIQLDQSLNYAPPSMDIQASLSPVGFVRPNLGMNGSNFNPTVVKPMTEPRFSRNRVNRE